MQGQIIRVKGTFSRKDLPRLTDFDTSHILREILNHPACVRFFDFTDMSKVKLDSTGKVQSVVDLQSDTVLSAEDASLRPLYSRGAFGGKGGIVFNGEHEAKVKNFFTGESSQSIDLCLQILLTSTGNKFIWSNAGNAEDAMYYKAQVMAGYNSVYSTNMGDSTYKVNRVVGVNNNRSGKMQFNDTQLITESPLKFPVSSRGDLNLGRWSDSAAANRGNFMLGHVALFNTDVLSDEYLNELLKEYYLRHYK